MPKKIVLLGFMLLILTGCATSTSYVQYTTQQFPPRNQYANVDVYPQGQSIGVSKVYYVIGRVSVEGFASSGVVPETLMNQARRLARQKGADAIINSKTVVYRYWNGDALLRFKGEFIVYASPK